MPDPILPPPSDKNQHALTGAGIRLGMDALDDHLPAWVKPLVPATVAVGKELWDNQNRAQHTPDKWDAAATVLGALLTYHNGDFTVVPTLTPDEVGVSGVWRF